MYTIAYVYMYSPSLSAEATWAVPIQSYFFGKA